MTRIPRRSALKLALAAGTAPLLGPFARTAFAADRIYAPRPNDWRSFEMRTRIALAKGEGPAEVWLPVPAITSDYQRSLDPTWTGNATSAALVTDPETGAEMLHAAFAPSVEAPEFEMVNRVEIRNRTIDWSARTEATEDPAVLARALAPSASKPLDGIVRDTAQKITAGADSDIAKVKAIYDWIVTNCHRDLDVPGCGPGDIEAILTTANLGGKCADLNGLFVGLARASGVPARDVFGVRVAPSEFGYQQLGANSGAITGAQHCRAEVWLDGYGWVAMDPADVLKVMRAETETWIKDPSDPLVAPVEAALFGNWEGNWVGYGSAEDVSLPGSDTRIPFLMYPQGVTAQGRLDALDAERFSYAMTVTGI